MWAPFGGRADPRRRHLLEPDDSVRRGVRLSGTRRHQHPLCAHPQCGGGVRFVSEDVGWAASPEGLFATSDGGQAWARHWPAPSLPGPLAAVSFGSASTGYAIPMDRPEAPVEPVTAGGRGLRSAHRRGPGRPLLPLRDSWLRLVAERTGLHRRRLLDMATPTHPGPATGHRRRGLCRCRKRLGRLLRRDALVHRRRGGRRGAGPDPFRGGDAEGRRRSF